MRYSRDEVLQYIREEDVKFIRLAFCDVFGRQKNISIMPDQLPWAFENGILFNAAAIDGFGDVANSDLLLHPDPGTLALLPWRPEHGRVVRMYSYITYPDGRPFECDCRYLLKKAAEKAENEGYQFCFGAEQELYLFKLDENGNPTHEPFDNAGYMDLAPDDRGENIRREICLTLEQMGIFPERSHHEEGPGQNEIVYRPSDPLAASDNAMTFQTVVRTIAYRNGLHADFGPKPLEKHPGNGFHINISVKSKDSQDLTCTVVAGILDKIQDITLFLNPLRESYLRLGSFKAPRYISWSRANRSVLVRIPAVANNYKRAELRSPDPAANPYIALTLLLYAGLYGIASDLELSAATDINFYETVSDLPAGIKVLPSSLEEARSLALRSTFVKEILPERIIKSYTSR